MGCGIPEEELTRFLLENRRKPDIESCAETMSGLGCLIQNFSNATPVLTPTLSSSWNGDAASDNIDASPSPEQGIVATHIYQTM